MKTPSSNADGRLVDSDRLLTTAIPAVLEVQLQRELQVAVIRNRARDACT